jgi:hypothetical protein
MMNSQIWASRLRIASRADQCRPQRTRRVDRGAGDVDTEQMDRHQGQADGETGEPDRSASLRHAENADQEQEGADHLVDEGRPHIVLAEIAGTPAILAERSAPAGSLPQEDEIEHGSAGDRAEHLGDHIHDEIGGRHAPRHEHAEAHRRIDMAARDLADAVGHGDDGETESGGDAENVDRGRPAAHPADDGRAAADQDQANVPMNSAVALFIVVSPLIGPPMMPEVRSRA